MKCTCMLMSLAVTAACSTSFTTTGRPDGETDTAVDVATDSTTACTTDSDCVVALHQDRCCTPDPVAVTRAALAADPCLSELGTGIERSDECMEIDCFACSPIRERFYAARCVDGACAGISDFCAPMEPPLPEGEFRAWHPPDGGWAPYRNRVVTITGNPYLGPDSCACCFECDCTCFETEVQHTLDCEIAIRGSACSIEYACTGTECDPACSPAELNWSEVIQGYLVDSDAEGWEIWAMNGPGDCPPPGPNAEDEPCTPGSTEDCAGDLDCFYWDDIMEVCAGTCRPWGEECETDPDCPVEEVCYMGYCVWCCPG